MDTVRKVLHFLSTVFLYSLLIIVLIIAVFFGAYVIDQMIGMKNHEDRSPLFGVYVIISPSMVPNINVYDAVVTMRVPTDKIEMYDVITFLSKDINTHGTPITHRVVGIVETEDGKIGYRTKGDNNNAEDNALIMEDEVIGKVLFRIPMIGYVRTFITSRIGWLLIVVLPCVGIIIYDVGKLVGLIKNSKALPESENNRDKEKRKKS
ncbi:MAG TPA: signal peptidase I [Candidatus Scybalousia intestinigallinarum]|nr:signal peptidase I [Candidatus Scybalousia intestinigallinarum]